MNNNTNNINNTCITLDYMNQTTTDFETCTIHFTDESEQAKAFNHLIHSRASFSGVDESTITIKKSDCMALKSKDIHYEEIS